MYKFLITVTSQIHAQIAIFITLIFVAKAFVHFTVSMAQIYSSCKAPFLLSKCTKELPKHAVLKIQWQNRLQEINVRYQTVKIFLWLNVTWYWQGIPVI